MSDVDVPADYLQFLLKQSDLWPETRGQIEAELKRRTTAAPSRASVEAAEPMDARLRGDEERAVGSRCPHYGRGLTAFVRLTK